MKVKVGVSARHVHLKKETLEKLFGENFELEVYKPLTQKGQFASTSKITIKSENNVIENVRILGPLREYNQVEISKTDSIKLKLDPPVRKSGDLSESEKITLVGPKGEVFLEEAVIIANRHIHIDPIDARELGLMNGDVVKVRFNTIKAVTLENVKIKMNPEYSFEMHIDTDDANANLITNGMEGTIIK